MFGNHLLDSLAASQPELLRNRLIPLDYLQGDILAGHGASIERAVFPRAGLISVVTDLSDGDHVQVAMVGSQGAVGTAATFGARYRVGSAVAQSAGRAWAIQINHLKELASFFECRRLLFAQVRYLLAQAQQTAACNARHTIMPRLCSWLLRAHDACGGRDLFVTQENIAHMLGVQRATICMFASQLQEEGAIQYRRGRLHIENIDRLGRHACECRVEIRRQYEHLFTLDNRQTRSECVASAS